MKEKCLHRTMVVLLICNQGMMVRIRLEAFWAGSIIGNAPDCRSGGFGHCGFKSYPSHLAAVLRHQVHHQMPVKFKSLETAGRRPAFRKMMKRLSYNPDKIVFRVRVSIFLLHPGISGFGYALPN